MNLGLLLPPLFTSYIFPKQSREDKWHRVSNGWMSIPVNIRSTKRNKLARLYSLCFV